MKLVCTQQRLASSAVLLIAIGAAVPCAGFAQSAKTESPYRLSVGAEPFRLAMPDKPLSTRNVPSEFADKPYAAMISKAATEAALDPALVHAVIHIESGYNPMARSSKGALGLMQVMPDTALRYGVKDPGMSPQENLRAGTRYLKDLMQLFSNRLELVLAAYNAGEHAVLRHGGRIPPYRETQNYVPAVLAKYRELKRVAEPVNKVKRNEYMQGTRLTQLPAAPADPYLQ